MKERYMKYMPVLGKGLVQNCNHWLVSWNRGFNQSLFYKQNSELTASCLDGLIQT